MKWSTACPDWEKRIVSGESLIPMKPLFPEEAEEALRVFKLLKVVDMPGMPTFGEVCRPWVFEFVAAIFGSYDATTGRRLINEFFMLISKKNTKSTIAAGIMVTALIRNWRNYAELNILAPTIEVAKNSASPAMGMVQNEPELLEMLRPVPHQRMIEHRTTKAELKIVAADSETVSGKKSSFVLLDEMWLFGKMAHAEDMLREATGGLASREEGFVIALSTASNEAPAGVFLDWLNRFRNIRDGKLEAPRSLGILYEFPKYLLDAEAYTKPELFHITNPNLGASVSRTYLADEYEKAKQKGQKSLIGFYAKHLNVEVGISIRANNWAGAEYWEQRADSSITFETLLERCEVVIVGVDGGGLDDLLGLNVLGRERVGTPIEVTDEEGVVRTKIEKRWLSWTRAWCHKSVLTRRQSIASTLQGFEKDGDLRIVAQQTTAISEAVSYVEKVKDAGLLHCVAVDPMAIGTLVDALAEIDVTQQNKESESNYLIGVTQGIGLMSALKTCENKLADGTLLHADQALMTWAVGNLKIEATATAIRATKQNAGDAKIDPAMALFDGSVLMSLNPTGTTSVFDLMTDGEDEQSGADAPLSDAEEATILTDPHHPRWQEARERYEARLAAEDRDEY